MASMIELDELRDAILAAEQDIGARERPFLAGMLAAIADAARYRWLNREAWVMDTFSDGTDTDMAAEKGVADAFTELDGSEAALARLNAAIDAARGVCHGG